jgi:hypothetical protein
MEEKKEEKDRRRRGKERMHESVRESCGGEVGILIVGAREVGEATSVMEERSFAVPNKQSGRGDDGLGEERGRVAKVPTLDGMTAGRDRRPQLPGWDTSACACACACLCSCLCSCSIVRIMASVDAGTLGNRCLGRIGYLDWTIP